MIINKHKAKKSPKRQKQRNLTAECSWTLDALQGRSLETKILQCVFVKTLKPKGVLLLNQVYFESNLFINISEYLK